MNYLEVLHKIVGSGVTAANEPVIILSDYKAAEYMSAVINAEGGTGSIYGPFEYRKEHSETRLRVWEVSLSEIAADSPKELAVRPIDI